MTLAHDATTLLQRLIRLDTVNPPGNERPAQELLRGELEAAGLRVRAARRERRAPEPRCAFARRVGRAARSVTWATSTRCSRTPASGRVDPWSGELRDGHVWGRGALDMKGQVACEVAAACALGRSGWRPASGELLVIATCDEEAGATIGAQWLCEHVPEKVRCDMVVNEGAGEVVEYEGRRLYTLCVGEKGVFRFRLSTEGRAGHASMPAMGDNALLRMIDVLGAAGRPPAGARRVSRPASPRLEALLGRRPTTSRRPLDARARRRSPGSPPCWTR